MASSCGVFSAFPIAQIRWWRKEGGHRSGQPLCLASLRLGKPCNQGFNPDRSGLARSVSLLWYAIDESRSMSQTWLERVALAVTIAVAPAALLHAALPNFADAPARGSLAGQLLVAAPM